MYLKLWRSHKALLTACKAALKPSNCNNFKGTDFVKSVACYSKATFPKSLCDRVVEDPSNMNCMLWRYGITATSLLNRVRSQQQICTVMGSIATGHQRRHYRSGKSNRSARQEGSNLPHNRSPELMNFPWIIWPSLWHTIRNWIFANLIIRPYMDREFTLSSFKSGAIQALVHVSQELSRGNFPALEGLITKPSLDEAQNNFALLSLKQRLDLAVVAEDIFFCFPYQIGVMFTNEGGPKERVFVEITMCYHVFKGFQDHLENIAKSPASGTFTTVYDNYDRISIANYRFIREYTKGVEDQWTVNIANHFKPGEYLQRQ